MHRFAVLVDAGYLFAQGAALIAGAKQPREKLELDFPNVVAELKKVAASTCPDAHLLRIYWYDGVRFSGPTLEHKTLAGMDDVKVRLGFVNSAGQQKGVDSLIVTDLIELSRNSSITDALLLSGDEDVRIGVQIAQTYGVRVHLLGIHPARSSQSDTLMQEADTTHEWKKDVVETFLKTKTGMAQPKKFAGENEVDATGGPAVSIESHIKNFDQVRDETVAEVITTLTDTSREQLKDSFQTSPSVPPEFDGKLLGKCRAALGRDLDGKERSLLRSAFRDECAK